MNMATTVVVDDRLIQRALKVGGRRSTRTAVTEALQEYIQRREQVKILDLFGEIRYDPDYDYKQQRRR